MKVLKFCSIQIIRSKNTDRHVSIHPVKTRGSEYVGQTFLIKALD